MLKPKLRRPSFGRRGGLCVKCSFENTSFRVPRPCWYFFFFNYYFFCWVFAFVQPKSQFQALFVSFVTISSVILLFSGQSIVGMLFQKSLIHGSWNKLSYLNYLTSLFCLLNFIFNPISSLAPLPVELQDKHCVRISERSVLQETLRPQAYATRSQRQVMTS